MRIKSRNLGRKKSTGWWRVWGGGREEERIGWVPSSCFRLLVGAGKPFSLLPMFVTHVPPLLSHEHFTPHWSHRAWCFPCTSNVYGPSWVSYKSNSSLTLPTRTVSHPTGYGLRPIRLALPTSDPITTSRSPGYLQLPPNLAANRRVPQPPS